MGVQDGTILALTSKAALSLAEPRCVPLRVSEVQLWGRVGGRGASCSADGARCWAGWRTLFCWGARCYAGAHAALLGGGRYSAGARVGVLSGACAGWHALLCRVARAALLGHGLLCWVARAALLGLALLFWVARCSAGARATLQGGACCSAGVRAALLDGARCSAEARAALLGRGFCNTSHPPPELQELLKQFPGIFPDDLPEGLPPQRAHDHRIELEPGAQPTVQRQFRLTQPEFVELRKQLDYLLEKKNIRPSSSPFAAPILFTSKKDGGFCMCIDYRALKRVTVESRYPIPRADELIDQLRTALVFSKIDLRGGYHQIRVEPSDCAKTAFRTRYGSFEYTVMPFGLTNAPATFLMTMNEAFRPLLDKCVIIYLDDILVYIRDKQQHLADLEAVFTVLDKNKLLTKGSKCDFFQDRLEFLGHVISEAGVEIDPKKLDTLKAWNPPTNITELQSFLGFVNYVRRFVPDMAHLTAPLMDLLRKGVTFTWGEKEHAAFSTLKTVLCSLPVLRIADPHRPFKVVTDASDIAIGAVLLQDFGNGLQPIAYESRKMHPPEKNYPIHDREMFAIVHAFKVWRCYLTGADVTVRTDHKSLQYLRAQPHLNPRQIRWLDYLESNFHYTVTYKKG
ncbi:unnamed protein product, partial [Closterium sp. NIES-54]